MLNLATKLRCQSDRQRASVRIDLNAIIVYELIANKIRWNDFVENEITCFIMGYSVMQSVVDGGVH